MIPAGLAIADEVAAALSAGRPVVALESTIIAHGIPAPRNLELARALEAAVRDAGAVPATVAVRGGRLRIGLSGEELRALAEAGPAFPKLSRRDLPHALARGGNGATTVAATMAAAAAAGIAVFATGGIGGVHRGAAGSFDVSADLLELSRTRVAVVASGVKAILDLEKTLEALETLAVPVLGYGCDELPGFYARGSGLRLEARCDTPVEVAAVLEQHWRLPGAGGILVASPVPQQAALDRDQLEGIIAGGLERAARDGVTGKRVTPFLLAHVAAATGGASIEANVALAVSNARLAAAIGAARAKEAR